MIHYFNPGHESAVLNGSRFYQPNANVVKMQEDLAFLPAWYASSGDFVLTGQTLTTDFLSSVQSLSPLARAITSADFLSDREQFLNEEVNLWGISPQSIHYFEQQNKRYDLRLKIPEWKESYHPLGGRPIAKECLSFLINNFAEIENRILPVYLSDTAEIEEYIINSGEQQVVKSPYSSSGRGLIWLPPEKLAQSERQILSGMLKRQKEVSVEPALDKRLDFSMHFEIQSEKEVRFIGYSLFQTNDKGAYEKSILINQEELEAKITAFIDKGLLLSVKSKLLTFIQQKYSPDYKGNIGVDMLIYQSDNQYHLNPCVEINMRKSMGYLAIQLFKNYILPSSQGAFFVKYYPEGQAIRQHEELMKQYPLVLDGQKIKSGYLALCPVAENSQYHAYVNTTP